MRLMFVYWPLETAGSWRDLQHYTLAARELGHEVVLYGPPAEPTHGVARSLDAAAADAVIFVLEWNLYLAPGSRLNLARLLEQVPRERRIVIDCDGMYEPAIEVDGDSNHPDAAASRERRAIYESLADTVYQPAPRPHQPHVRSFLFHAYSPDWAVPLDFTHKPFGLRYVGNNWYRWRPLVRVLKAVEPIRDRVGRIGLTGHCWDAMPHWIASPLRETACFTDPEWLAGLGIEIMPAVPLDDVIATMSEGICNPVLIRPLFNYLNLVTVRTFETPAASTIPLFAQSEAYVRAIYGEAALPLVLGEGAAATERIADVLARPARYAPLVEEIRAHLAIHHSYTARLEQLLAIIQGRPATNP